MQTSCPSFISDKLVYLFFSQHLAAVKAVSWCPWQSGILATGGGTADKAIKIWNINSGNLINSVDTKSQVCFLSFRVINGPFLLFWKGCEDFFFVG